MMWGGGEEIKKIAIWVQIFHSYWCFHLNKKNLKKQFSEGGKTFSDIHYYNTILRKMTLCLQQLNLIMDSILTQVSRNKVLRGKLSLILYFCNRVYDLCDLKLWILLDQKVKFLNSTVCKDMGTRELECSVPWRGGNWALAASFL